MPWCGQAQFPAHKMRQQAIGCGGTCLWAAESPPRNIRNCKRQMKEYGREYKGKYENIIRVNYLGKGLLMSLLIVFLFWGKERERVQPFLEVQ